MKRVMISLAVAALAVVPASANSSYDAKGVIELTNDQLADFLSDGTLQSSEASSLMDLIAVEEIGRFALGKYARTASDADLSAYNAAFSGYLQEQLQKHLSDVGAVQFEIVDTVERSADDVVVETSAEGADTKLSNVNWRLKKIDGQWKVIDVEAMGLWLAIEQRAQFDAKLGNSNGDVSALAASL